MAPSMEGKGFKRWYQLPRKEALYRLRTSEHGLTETEARERLRSHGPNKLPEEERISRLRIRSPSVHESPDLHPPHRRCRDFHLGRTHDDGLPEMMKKVEYLEYLVLEEKPYIERDLVVPRPSGVELSSEGAYLFSKPRLDCHVDVFHGGRELYFARVYLLFNGFEAVDYLFGLFARENARLLESQAWAMEPSMSNL